MYEKYHKSMFRSCVHENTLENSYTLHMVGPINRGCNSLCTCTAYMCTLDRLILLCSIFAAQRCSILSRNVLSYTNNVYSSTTENRVLCKPKMPLNTCGWLPNHHINGLNDKWLRWFSDNFAYANQSTVRILRQQATHSLCTICTSTFTLPMPCA